ncbi:MAG: hypothetical protein DRO99_04010, partial [Candidatus Aenigmatarchaeota archaeon]
QEFAPVYELVSVRTSANDDSSEAELTIKAGGKLYSRKASGDGMIDAATRAVNAITGLDMDIIDYRSESATPGSEALGRECVVVGNNGYRVKGHGIDSDTVRGAAKAYVDAVNRMRFVMDTVEAYKTRNQT